MRPQAGPAGRAGGGAPHPGSTPARPGHGADGGLVSGGGDLPWEFPFSSAYAPEGRGVDVPGVEGTSGLRIPAGVQSQTVLRLRGKGLPRFQGHGRGDLLVRVNLETPTRLSAEERRLLEELRRLRRA